MEAEASFEDIAMKLKRWMKRVMMAIGLLLYWECCMSAYVDMASHKMSMMLVECGHDVVAALGHAEADGMAVVDTDDPALRWDGKEALSKG
ncbi:hypothetical protein P389DRAFT_168855 [Cystobasidium minutum MCA 4210]|uniref:uncharacterized protein n=1 Tax=Cystobasidium minutum MCA 4210 TaxID=1397322 RepID=UPI0034CE1CB6|eukprot:jgi/Rhomi1/168855/fgenesh1_kg.3_\